MKIYLIAIFVGLLIVSNIISIKLFTLMGFILPVAALAYVFTYPITDTISEVYGKKSAKQAVLAGFIAQIIVTIFIFVAINLPPAEFFGLQSEYETILGSGLRIIFASLIAYGISQFLDVYIFHKLKEKHGTKKLWLRNNVSTTISQALDTIIFITIAFIGIVPFNILIGMIAVQYGFKVLIAIIDTPLVYLLVKIARRAN